MQLIFLSLILILCNITIPTVPLIVWYEVNYGRTILPEIMVIMNTITYIMWRLMWWKFISGTNIHIKGKGYM